MKHIVIEVTERSAVEVVGTTPFTSDKLMWSGDGFLVYVRMATGVKLSQHYHKAQHAALVAVQANGGHCSALQRVTERKQGSRKARKHVQDARPYTKELF